MTTMRRPTRSEATNAGRWVPGSVRSALVVLTLTACQGAPEPSPSVTPAPTADRRGPGMPHQAADVPHQAADVPAQAPEAVVISEPAQREAAVGKRVVIIGVQTRAKMPQVNGVDVDADHGLAERRVRVEGILRKRVIEPTESDPDELPIATRGPGTYYSVVDPETGQLARPRPE